MLTRIEIDGFKTFENLAVDLAPFVVILGSNAAGKSNLFDAIQLLSNLATQDVSEAIKDMRGEPMELFRRTPKGQATRMSFAVEVLVDPSVRDPWGSEVNLGHTRMRYEVVLELREVRPGIPRVLVASENARPILRMEDSWARALRPTRAFRSKHLKYSRKKPLLTTERTSAGSAIFNVHQDGKAGRTRPASAAEATVLYSITNAEFPHLFALREEMRNWRLLQLDPALLRRPAPATAPDLLTPDGSNLAAVLARIKLETASETRPTGALADITAELNALIPGVNGLDASLDQTRGEYRAELTMRDGLPFSSRVVSDGTLRVLALLTLLHDPRHRGLVCFEEPENGVHPARLKQLVHGLRDMVTRPERFEETDVAPLNQLLLNSHSPVVLSALVGPTLQSRGDPVLFADTSSVVDPERGEVRRHTRLRPVMRESQGRLAESEDDAPLPVSHFEVEKLLQTTLAEG
ncbi:AAA family ATPase [uncultured Azohydromonas sp.]|jgi:Predicted ATPase|uniref:AAA family ATPase n=1 Tax=uncultured Azohydromonas sp. TaxID=487342 RepID=UPI00260B4188|nr:AAA family ATPase [uncultured Azohydromonas sp.]